MMALVFGSAASAQQPMMPPTVQLSLYDQFETKHDLSELRGQVVILFYGDRDGMQENKDLGQRLHVQFHPSAAGKPPGTASDAPVIPLAGLPEGAMSPNVRVIPVACVGEVPGLVENIVRNQAKAASPKVPVWLDFGESMKNTFGIKEGAPNLAVIDTEGRLRWKAHGNLDPATYARLVQVIDILRREAVGLSNGQ
jgi:hypothetical protein